jgi:hypothetical protein
LLLGLGASHTTSGIGSSSASASTASTVVDLTEMDVVIDSIEIQQIHADIALAVHHYERAVGYLAGSRSLADCPKATLAVQSSRVTKGKKKVPVSALPDGREGDKATQTSTAEKGLQELEILECRFKCVLAFLYLHEGTNIYIYKSVDINFIYIYVYMCIYLYIYICIYMFMFVLKVKLWKQKSTLH